MELGTVDAVTEQQQRRRPYDRMADHKILFCKQKLFFALKHNLDSLSYSVPFSIILLHNSRVVCICLFVQSFEMNASHMLAAFILHIR